MPARYAEGDKEIEFAVELLRAEKTLAFLVADNTVSFKIPEVVDYELATIHAR